MLFHNGSDGIMFDGDPMPVYDMIALLNEYGATGLTCNMHRLQNDLMTTAQIDLGYLLDAFNDAVNGMDGSAIEVDSFIDVLAASYHGRVKPFLEPVKVASGGQRPPDAGVVVPVAGGGQPPPRRGVLVSLAAAFGGGAGGSLFLLSDLLEPPPTTQPTTRPDADGE